MTLEEYYKNNQIGIDVVRRKYLMKSENHIEESFWRVINPLLEFEKDKSIGDYWFETLMDGKWRMGGSIWATVGNTEFPKQSTANCTTNIIKEDSLEGIFKIAYEVAKCAAYRQGIGIRFSELRPTGEKINNSARISSGAIHWMKFISNEVDFVGQSGRKPALLFDLDVWYPDIYDFVKMKDDINVMQNVNISVIMNNDFLEKVKNDEFWDLVWNGKVYNTVKARHLFDFIAEHAWKTGEPGIQLIDVMNDYSMQKYVGYPIVCSNAPVIGSSFVFTKEGIFSIEDLYESQKEHDILVDSRHFEKDLMELLEKDRVKGRYGNVFFTKGIFKKYENQDEYEVSLSNGRKVYCNDEHRWLTTKGYKRTIDLGVGDKILLPSDGIWTEKLTESEINSSDYKDGVLLGWFVGDGFFYKMSNTGRLNEDKNNPNKWESFDDRYGVSIIWKDGEEKAPELFKKKYHEITGGELNYIDDRGSNYRLKTASKEFYNWIASYGFVNDKYMVPKKCFTNRVFAAGFISGLFSADGGVTKQKGAIRLWSISHKLISDVQILLQAFGINGIIVSEKSKGIDYFVKSGEKRTSNYKKICYNLQFTNRIYRNRFFERINGFFCSNTKQEILKKLVNKNFKKNYDHFFSVDVKSIQKTGKKKTMYCGYVKDVHGLVIEGLMSSNCSEKPLPDYSVCNLASINLGKLSKENYKKELDKLVPAIVRFLDDVTSYELKYDKSPIPQQKEVVSALREIGVGILNIQGFLNKYDIPYDSDEGIDLIEKIIKYIAKKTFETSHELAKERGPFKAFDLEKIKHSPYYQLMCKETGLKDPILRTASNLSIAPSGCGLKTNEIITENGIETYEDILRANDIDVDEIEKTNEKQWFTIEPLEIAVDDDKFMATEKIYYNGWENTRTIIFEDGTNVTFTLNHKLFVESNNKFAWKEVRDLEVGDGVVSFVDDYEKEENDITIKIAKIIDNKEKMPTWDIEVPEYHYYLLKNGCVSHNTISLTFPEPTLSSGIEPAIGFAYWRRTRISGNWDWYFVFTDEVRQRLLKCDLEENEKKFISNLGESVLDNSGEIGKTAMFIIKKYGIDKVLRGAHDISPERKMELISRVQKWVDAGISTTFNLPESATVDDVKNLYMSAYDKKVKSISVYRQGSRDEILRFIPPTKDKKKEVKRPDSIIYHHAPKRPKNLPCNIHKTVVRGEKWVVLIGLMDERPYEVFAGKYEKIDEIPTTATKGEIIKVKSGRYDLHIKTERKDVLIEDIGHTFLNKSNAALTRALSGEMRHGMPLNYIIDQLEKAEGSVVDFSKAIARVLKKYDNNYEPDVKTCPVCGNGLVNSGGCLSCLECGWSKCG